MTSDQSDDHEADILINQSITIDQSITDNVCVRECPDRWCECVDRYVPGQSFAAPPLCPGEIDAIQRSGRTDFCEPNATGVQLKTRTDGTCVFFDPERKLCGIYELRPFDCRMFPFDFVASGPDEAWWLLWDCPYSRRIEPGRIEEILAHFETVYRDRIIDLWEYENESYLELIRAKKDSGFRLLRRVRVLLAETSDTVSGSGSHDH